MRYQTAKKPMRDCVGPLSQANGCATLGVGMLFLASVDEGGLVWPAKDSVSAVLSARGVDRA